MNVSKRFESDWKTWTTTTRGKTITQAGWWVATRISSVELRVSLFLSLSLLSVKVKINNSVAAHIRMYVSHDNL